MLPAEVTVAILQHIPQQQRLGQCALVCRSWLAAAGAATVSVSAEPTRPAHMESLSRWLQDHGSGVSDLSIVALQSRPEGRLNLDMPCSYSQQLRELPLAGLNTNASNNDNISRTSSLHSGTWAHFTALTSLHLASVTVYNVRDGSEFTSITSLRRLVLCDVDLSCKGLPSLAPLIQLTSLVLENIAHMEGELQAIGHLSQLKELKLAIDDYVIQVINSLPLSLTHLDLGRPREGIATWEITPFSAPRLAELTALVHLEVRGGDQTCFDPQLLSHLVQLQHLTLGSCQLKHSWEADEGVDRLLAVLPRLSNLQHLDLVRSMVCPTEAVQQYSALVSSSALTHLDLRDCRLQNHAVLYMFNGQHCPALQRLRLGANNLYLGSVFEGNQMVTLPARMFALDALTAACPALRELQLLDATVDPNCWTQLSALKNLTDLSKLALGCDVILDDSVALLKSLRLPALRDLKVDSRGVDESEFTAGGVLHFREFTQLTRLEVQLNGLGCGDDRKVLFTDQDGLTHLPELFDAAFQNNLPVSKRAQMIQQRDSNAEVMRLVQEIKLHFRHKLGHHRDAPRGPRSVT